MYPTCNNDVMQGLQGLWQCFGKGGMGKVLLEL